MSRRIPVIASVAVLAGLIFAANYSTSEAQMGMAKFKPVTQVLEGNYRVHYELTFADNSGAKDKMELIKRIEFHPDYVVLIDQNGAGRLIPVHAIKHLTWNRS